MMVENEVIVRTIIIQLKPLIPSASVAEVMLDRRKSVSKKQRAMRSSLKALLKLGPLKIKTAPKFPKNPNVMKIDDNCGDK